jgi:hypothetical protein
VKQRTLWQSIEYAIEPFQQFFVSFLSVDPLFPRFQSLGLDLEEFTHPFILYGKLCKQTFMPCLVLCACASPQKILPSPRKFSENFPPPCITPRETLMEKSRLLNVLNAANG